MSAIHRETRALCVRSVRLRVCSSEQTVNSLGFSRDKYNLKTFYIKKKKIADFCELGFFGGSGCFGFVSLWLVVFLGEGGG